MTSPTSPTLFTLGYQQRSQTEFVRLLIDAAVDDCHRGVLAERWQRGSWREVEHLGADSSCRLIRA